MGMSFFPQTSNSQPGVLAPQAYVIGEDVHQQILCSKEK